MFHKTIHSFILGIAFAATPTLLAATPSAVTTLLASAEAAMARLDLSTANAEYAVTIDAPEGAVAKDDFGSVAVKQGDQFQIEILSGQCDIAARKAEIKGNTLNKLKQFIVESDSELIYESEVFGKSEFHFVLNVPVGATTYTVQDTKGPNYTQAEVETMVKSAKSMAAK